MNATATMTGQEFTTLTGQPPEQDDLERVNCKQAGTLGHSQCGTCPDCGFPRFIPKLAGRGLLCDHREGTQHLTNCGCELCKETSWLLSLEKYEAWFDAAQD